MKEIRSSFGKFKFFNFYWLGKCHRLKPYYITYAIRHWGYGWLISYKPKEWSIELFLGFPYIQIGRWK